MHLILPKCTLFFRNAPDSRKNAPCFQKCTRLSKKCTPLFQKCTLKNQKCTRAFSLGAFFYQNRCTKPTERQGYVPTQIIEKREILTVRVSLSHFYPTLIRQLPSHFCFKTLLWVLAQAPPLHEDGTVVLPVVAIHELTADPVHAVGKGLAPPAQCQRQSLYRLGRMRKNASPLRIPILRAATPQLFTLHCSLFTYSDDRGGTNDPYHPGSCSPKN